MPTQTPGPRRFAPPASSSSTRSTAFSSTTARFARPSQPTSSPFTRTPFSSNVRKDVIESDDDDDHEDDDDNDLGARATTAPSRHLFRATNPHYPSNDRAVSITREAAPRTSIELGVEQNTLDPESTPALKGLKRRKVSHFSPEILDHQSDLLNSSPPASSPTQDQANAHHEHETTAPHPHPPSSLSRATIENVLPRQDTDHDSSPLHPDEDSPGKEFATPKMRNSRFRNPLTQSSQAHPEYQLLSKSAEQPMPSFQSRLLAASTVSPAGSHPHGPYPSIDYVLPDAFSPSHRRGQQEQEYEKHGHAETVRSWVLDIAAQSGIGDESCVTKLHTSPDTDANKFTITEVIHRDRDDRFAIVSTSDQEEKWMLVDTDSQPVPQPNIGMTPKSRIERLRTGSRFVLKDAQVSSWKLNIRSNSEACDQSEADEPIPGTASRVAVLWDLIH